MFRPIAATGFDSFLAKRVLYNMPKPLGDVGISSSFCVLLLSMQIDGEISTSPRGLGILYKTLLARKLSKPEDGLYRPKHVVFPLLINTII
jgi:hypothetical protein